MTNRCTTARRSVSRHEDDSRSDRRFCLARLLPRRADGLCPQSARPFGPRRLGIVMKAVVIGEGSGASLETIMSVFPRHKVVVDRFVARGEVIGIGPFADLGNMAIFRTRAGSEEFAKEDPFILEGIVGSVAIRDWDDKMLV